MTEDTVRFFTVSGLLVADGLLAKLSHNALRVYLVVQYHAALATSNTFDICGGTLMEQSGLETLDELLGALDELKATPLTVGGEETHE